MTFDSETNKLVFSPSPYGAPTSPTRTTSQDDEAVPTNRQPSPSDTVWRRRLVGDKENAALLLQYQPAAWAELQVQRSFTPNKVKLPITELTLEIDVD